MTSTGRLIVFTDPVEGLEEENNRWYDEAHIAELLLVPGIVSAYRLEAAQLGGAPDGYKYAAICEIDRDQAEVARALARLTRKGTVSVSPSVNLVDASATWWTRPPRS